MHGHTPAHGNTTHAHRGSGPVWCSCVALWVMSWGMRRGRAGPELLRCSFVYTDGFQMLASDQSATERWGAAQQFGACASKPGLRQLYLGYFKNMALPSNNCSCFALHVAILNISVTEVLICWGNTCSAQWRLMSLSVIISHKIYTWINCIWLWLKYLFYSVIWLCFSFNKLQPSLCSDADWKERFCTL